tara:strand:- start:205 stop:387 length:183 start_codon:yes stop_codon:yes gene_type:complete
MSEVNYNPNEWTACPTDCAYCTDMFYGHPHPHPTQRRVEGKGSLNTLLENTQLNPEEVKE